MLGILRQAPGAHVRNICCGGGVLRDGATRTTGRVAGHDHSADRVALAWDNNAHTVVESRLQVRRSGASAVPWEGTTLGAVTNANALFCPPSPVDVFGEACRVLRRSGLLAERHCLRVSRPEVVRRIRETGLLTPHVEPEHVLIFVPLHGE